MRTYYHVKSIDNTDQYEFETESGAWTTDLNRARIWTKDEASRFTFENPGAEFMGTDEFEDQEAAEPAPDYFTVRVYLTDRAYGGPEEGGWYYDCGQAAREFGWLTRAFKDREEAVTYARTITTLHLDPENADRPSVSSVLSEGRYAAEIWDNEAPLHYPAERPHYE